MESTHAHVHEDIIQEIVNDIIKSSLSVHAYKQGWSQCGTFDPQCMHTPSYATPIFVSLLLGVSGPLSPIPLIFLKKN